MEVDLTNSELFKSFAEFEQDGVYIDLHNEFDCKVIAFSSDTKQLTLTFKANECCKRGINSVELVFDDCIIEHYSAKLNKSDTDSGTLDLMYRGRFEISSGHLGEVSDTGKHYYYINFLPDVSIELFSKSVRAKVYLG
ncbi:hypothetical protein GWR56_09705 [Mucilaginibacter sp. 14171R-50]|uniref:hypothetical protein n=1 Tax=Mucilaginibacter sp. 14171R-50 TaxID=2703789 RepID=UPI00138B975F|nr:hypothetical protein [Mucilaginibacter sp. 14171R-50]QHS55795.1 hypothetical protein GWR56_09705 [Mucilaginibacter sp. 14171R-50]